VICRLFGYVTSTDWPFFGSIIISLRGAVGSVGGWRGGYFLKNRRRRFGRERASVIGSATSAALVASCDIGMFK
jgi:hypothetical protein